MRYLGLDLGTKSLGISITDKTNSFAFPYGVIKFKFEDYDEALEELKKVILKEDISHIVLGLPKNMDGTLGFAAQRSLKFKEMLLKLDLIVILEDERLTTMESLNIVHQNGKTEKDTKNKIDAISAAIILESYLKRCKNDFEK